MIVRPPLAPALTPASFFRDRANAERIGRRYLASLGAETNRNAILGASPPLQRALASPPGQAAEMLRHAIDADFRRGDVAVVDGWVLAKSEARLCALVALG